MVSLKTVIVYVFINILGVKASVESVIHSVETQLDYLEDRVNTQIDEVMSEIYFMEESIIRLNSSQNVSIGGRCSLLEEPARVHRIIKQYEDEFAELGDETYAANNEIKIKKRWLRLKIIDWVNSIRLVKLQMENLQSKQENLERLLQEYENKIEDITFNECNSTNVAKESKQEMYEDLPFLNESVTNKYPPPTTPCEDGWFLFDKHCYKYESQVHNFSSARDLCRISNAYIADVESRSESKFIYSLTGDGYTWIGIKEEQEGNVWISERTGQPITYMNWNHGDPDSRQAQKCAILGYRRRRYHKWIDEFCHLTFRFVCKKEATPVK